MKCSSASDWKIGDKGITNNGEIVTIKSVSDRFVLIEEKLDKKLYIPAHGEIEKLNKPITIELNINVAK